VPKIDDASITQNQRPEPPGPKDPDTEHPSREAPSPSKGKRPRGTAAMDPKTRQEVARKGGLAVSRNRAHMSSIGRKGGQSVSQNRDHMAEIGRRGGEASRSQRVTPGAVGLTRIPPVAPSPAETLGSPSEKGTLGESRREGASEAAIGEKKTGTS
jgi:general stress protein YciG